MRAIDSVKTPENEKVVNEMFSEWPFYRSRLSMLDMVFHKADPRISEAYDERLVPKELQNNDFMVKRCAFLCASLKAKWISSLLAITGNDDIMKNDPQGKESMEIQCRSLISSSPSTTCKLSFCAYRIRKAGDDAHKHQPRACHDGYHRGYCIALYEVCVIRANTQ